MSAENHDSGQDETKPITWVGLIKAMVILFVIGIYAVIFLKILFLK